MTPSTTLAERRAKIDRRLQTELERADEHALDLAVSTVETCPDRWFGQLVALSHAVVAEEPVPDAVLSVSAAVELLRGYCRLRTELLIQLDDDIAHSLTRDTADVLLSGDYLNSAAYSALAGAGTHHRKDAFTALVAVSKSLVTAFNAVDGRSVDESFLDATAGRLGEGAAVIGNSLVGDTPTRDDFATLGRGFSTAYQVHRILDPDDASATPSISLSQFDEHELKQYGEHRFRDAMRALDRLADSADVEPLRDFVNAHLEYDNEL